VLLKARESMNDRDAQLQNKKDQDNNERARMRDQYQQDADYFT